MNEPIVYLYNSLSKQKEPLIKRDAPIGMYVCGPTVYNRPHIGNARSVVVYDVLYRLLSLVYGAQEVTYVRNITDVDDKINDAAIARGISIQQLTHEVTQQFHSDMEALGCLLPTHEPRATEHIAEIIAMVERLIASGHAYESERHVLFDVTAPATHHWRYGMLSGRTIDEQEAGARIAVESYKRHAGDFVLWKPADAQDDPSSCFDSPWGVGRPGWHIECSAMSTRYLGVDFDIHGGGADLKFPHHENEIAQSCCANPHSHYARIWVHNGFLTVNGEKMSKSLGNFITVKDLLDAGIAGEAIRFALLSTHYAKPLDWNDKLLEDSVKQLDKLYTRMAEAEQVHHVDDAVLQALCQDVNMPKAIAALHQCDATQLSASGALLGVLQQVEAWKKAKERHDNVTKMTHLSCSLQEEEIMRLIEQRKIAKTQKNWAEADRIRHDCAERGILLIDAPDGTTTYQYA
jgi:cysteinyl-tRNA synthetase